MKKKKEKDFNKFKKIIQNQNNNISDKMKQALKLYNENIKYIENSFLELYPNKVFLFCANKLNIG